MGIKVYWTDFGKGELRAIFNYHHDKASVKVVHKIVRQIIDRADILSNFPESGVIEDLLKEKPQKFRYVVSSNYKIIYWLNREKNRVEIVDAFDTRQIPTKMERNK